MAFYSTAPLPAQAAAKASLALSSRPSEGYGRRGSGLHPAAEAVLNGRGGRCMVRCDAGLSSAERRGTQGGMIWDGNATKTHGSDATGAPTGVNHVTWQIVGRVGSRQTYAA